MQSKAVLRALSNERVLRNTAIMTSGCAGRCTDQFEFNLRLHDPRLSHEQLFYLNVNLIIQHQQNKHENKQTMSKLLFWPHPSVSFSHALFERMWCAQRLLHWSRLYMWPSVPSGLVLHCAPLAVALKHNEPWPSYATRNYPTNEMHITR